MGRPIKKARMTKEKLQELAGIASGYGGKLVGFIGGMPVIERDDVPEGVMYVMPGTTKYIFDARRMVKSLNKMPTKPTEVEGDIMRNFNKEFRNNDWYFRDWEQIERFISRNLATYKKEVQRETILEVLELVRDEDSWIADKIWGGYQKYLADGGEKKI